MKVILAGYSKTGTKTINAALTKLGYTVHDFIDHFWYNEKDWLKILQHGGTVSDFKRMYENVDAVVDAPAFLFWEEISQAFPDAKIIFSTREENEWAERLQKQLESSKHSSFLMPLYSAGQLKTFGRGISSNKMLLKKRFKEHNNYVLQNAPSERLLIYNVKEGWEPLCKFLGKEIPKTPFPWLNKDGSAIEPMIRSHPYAKRVQKEFLFICSVLIGILAMLLYFIFY